MADDLKKTLILSPSEAQKHRQLLQEHEEEMKKKAGLPTATVASSYVQPSLWALCQNGDFVLRERVLHKRVLDDYIQTYTSTGSIIIPQSYVFDRVNHYSANPGSLELRLSEGSILSVSNTSLLSPPVRIFRPGQSINASKLCSLPVGTPLCCDIEYKVSNNQWKEDGSYFHYAGFLGEKTAEDFKLHADARLKVILHKYHFHDFNQGALPQYAPGQLGSSPIGYGKISLHQLVPINPR